MASCRSRRSGSRATSEADFSKSAHLDARVSRARRKLKRSPDPRWNDAVREQDRAASGTALGPEHRKTKGQVFAERAVGRGKNLPGRLCLHPLAGRPVSLPFPCPGGRGTQCRRMPRIIHTCQNTTQLPGWALGWRSLPMRLSR